MAASASDTSVSKTEAMSAARFVRLIVFSAASSVLKPRFLRTAPIGVAIWLNTRCERPNELAFVFPQSRILSADSP